MKIHCLFTNLPQGSEPIPYFIIDFKKIGYEYHIVLINEYGREFKIMKLDEFNGNYRVNLSKIIGEND